MRAALTTLALCCLAGCQGAAPSTAVGKFFPLQAGHHWTYRVTTQLGEDTSSREQLTLRALGREDLPALEGGGGGGQAWRRRSDSGIEYWLRADGTGIYRVASKTDLEAEPLPDKAPRYVLKAPLVVGTQWQASTTTYLLMRNNEFPRELRYSHPSLPMSYQIDAIDEAVQTPAGNFSHCLRVRGAASVRVYADPASGWRDVPLVTQEWYCPDVGLVKLQRSELAKFGFLQGGVSTMELESWQ
jgi:hypothetical protein